MRGWDERRGALFSYVDLEVRVPADHPLRPIRATVNEALAALEGEFASLYARLGAALDPTREAGAGHAPAGVLFRPLGEPAHGADRVRPSLPLVRRARD